MKREITVNMGFAPPDLSWQGSFDCQKIIRIFSDRINSDKLSHFEKILRSSETNPPIKGEITKGKLKWRGIRLVKQDRCTHEAYWLEQRGKQIGGSYTVSMIIPKLVDRKKK